MDDEEFKAGMIRLNAAYERHHQQVAADEKLINMQFQRGRHWGIKWALENASWPHIVEVKSFHELRCSNPEEHTWELLWVSLANELRDSKTLDAGNVEFDTEFNSPSQGLVDGFLEGAAEIHDKFLERRARVD